MTIIVVMFVVHISLLIQNLLIFNNFIFIGILYDNIYIIRYVISKIWTIEPKRRNDMYSWPGWREWKLICRRIRFVSNQMDPMGDHRKAIPWWFSNFIGKRLRFAKKSLLPIYFINSFRRELRWIMTIVRRDRNLSSAMVPNIRVKH